VPIAFLIATQAVVRRLAVGQSPAPAHSRRSWLFVALPALSCSIGSRRRRCGGRFRKSWTTLRSSPANHCRTPNWRF